MAYFNKHLNAVNFNIYAVDEELKPFIDCYWKVEHENIVNTYEFRVLSDASMGISINLADPYSIQVLNEKKTYDEKFIIDGPTKHLSIMEFSKKLDLLGIRFGHAGAYVFFDESIHLFVDKHLKLINSDSWPIDELFLSLEKTTNIQEQIVILNDFFLKKLREKKRTNSIWIYEFIKIIIEKNGDVELSCLCEQFNLSLKQVERKFKEEVGLNPKTFIRIIRIKNTKDIISSLKTDTLTDIAYESGFFDQAHLSKEFKFFMDETPRNYLCKKQQLALESNYKKFEKIKYSSKELV